MDRPASRRLFFMVAVVAMTFAACGKKKEAPPPPPPTVEVATVVQKDVPIFQEWIGSLDGFVNAEIRPQIEGYLLKQDYREGFLVHAGETLFEIDPRQFQATYDQAKGYARPVRGHARQREDDGGALQTPGRAEGHQPAGAGRRRDAGAHGRRPTSRSARAALEKAKLDLGWTKVVSPIDGIAGVAKAQVGDLVNRLTVMTTVSQVDPIKVNFNPSEQEYLAWVAKHGPPEKTLSAGTEPRAGASAARPLGRLGLSAPRPGDPRRPRGGREDGHDPARGRVPESRATSCGPASTPRCASPWTSRRAPSSCRSGRSPSCRAATRSPSSARTTR